MKIEHLAALACAAVFLLCATPGRADTLQQQSFGTWKAEDNCAREAFKKSPDYTPEGNRTRELAYRRCIDRGNLPPRSDVSAPAAQPSPQPEPTQK